MAEEFAGVGCLCPSSSRRLSCSSVNSLGQQDPAPAAAPGIQDNSFLVEEAYNQNFGVVQHISSFTRFLDSKDWNYTFTQEWPVPGDERHQLSYTLVALHSGAFPGSGAGIGDVFLNYRYQLVGSGDTRVAFSPRLSLIFPTGDSTQGRGSGSFGLQTNLPLERRAQQETGQPLECRRHILSSCSGRLGRSGCDCRIQLWAELHLAGSRSLQCHAGNRVCPVTDGGGQQPDGVDQLALPQPRHPLGLQLQEWFADCSGNRSSAGSRAERG